MGKLPKQALARFGRNVLKRTAYWDSFKSVTHKSPALSDTDKFNYLWSLLDHSAHSAIAGLTLTSTNYAEAVKIFKKQFGNKDIISRHMKTLLEAEAVELDKNLHGLRKLYDQVKSHIRSFTASCYQHVPSQTREGSTYGYYPLLW